MNRLQLEILSENLNINLNDEKIKLFEKYIEFFLKKNSQLNLISKNDEKFLFEKHIYDSLAISKFFTPQKEGTLLDIGTGGGFPALPIAILYENLNVYAIDSIRKKINAIEEIKKELNIKNLFPICDRVENNTQQYDYVTTRAVASVDSVLKYAVPKMKKNAYLIAYKSKKALDELKEADKTIKKLKLKVADIIEYTLPLDEIFKRNLIIFKRLT